MAVFLVQLWPNGKWNGEDYRRVEAPTTKEAAEKACGAALSENGGLHQIRAQVRNPGNFKAAPIVFL